MKRSIHEKFMAPHSNIAPITSNALTVPNYFVIKPSHKTLRDRGQWRPSFAPRHAPAAADRLGEDSDRAVAVGGERDAVAQRNVDAAAGAGRIVAAGVHGQAAVEIVDRFREDVAGDTAAAATDWAKMP